MTELVVTGDRVCAPKISRPSDREIATLQLGLTFYFATLGANFQLVRLDIQAATRLGDRLIASGHYECWDSTLAGQR